jgi:hypothetical protein
VFSVWPAMLSSFVWNRFITKAKSPHGILDLVEGRFGMSRLSRHRKYTHVAVRIREYFSKWNSKGKNVTFSQFSFVIAQLIYYEFLWECKYNNVFLET